MSVIKLKQLAITFEEADCTFEQCYEFLCQVRMDRGQRMFRCRHFRNFGNKFSFFLQLIESGAKVVRGPYLGRLELHHTMTELNENANELLGDFLELLVEYFRKVKSIFPVDNAQTKANKSNCSISLARNRAVRTT